jgi:hypothetical protein
LYSSPNIIGDEVREDKMAMAWGGEERRGIHTEWWEVQKEGDH